MKNAPVLLQRTGAFFAIPYTTAMILFRKSGKRTEYAQEVFSTDRHEIKIGGATYCVQRSFRGSEQRRRDHCKENLGIVETDGKIDVSAPVSYNMNGKLVQGG